LERLWRGAQKEKFDWNAFGQSSIFVVDLLVPGNDFGQLDSRQFSSSTLLIYLVPGTVVLGRFSSTYWLLVIATVFELFGTFWSLVILTFDHCHCVSLVFDFRSIQWVMGPLFLQHKTDGSAGSVTNTRLYHDRFQTGSPFD